MDKLSCRDVLENQIRLLIDVNRSLGSHDMVANSDQIRQNALAIKHIAEFLSWEAARV